MSTFTKYYQANRAENPYTMESFKDSSRVKTLIDLIPKYVKPGGKILDVGCGDMYLSKQHPQFDWVGIDINTHVNEGRAIKQDLDKVPYPFDSKSFDAVICSEVLEHLFDPSAVTKEISRVLKPGGIYIVSTPNFNFIDHFLHDFQNIVYDSEKSWTKEHIHMYNKESHVKLLTENGFLLQDYTGCDPSAGLFFPKARSVYFHYFTQAGMSDEEAINLSDKLLGEAFRDWMHTILLIAKKG